MSAQKILFLTFLKYSEQTHFLAIQLKSMDLLLIDLDLDDRITISSMATEMGAIIILFPPSEEIIEYCSSTFKNKV